MNLVNVDEQISVFKINAFRLFKEAFIDKILFFHQSYNLFLTEQLAHKKLIEDFMFWSNNNTFKGLL